MKLPPELEAKILELAGQKPADPPRPERPPELVAPAFAAPGTLTVPVATAVEVNGRNWKGRSARTHAARLAVSRVAGPNLRSLAAFAEHYHAGGSLRAVFVRLGGQKCDRSNLPTAMKAVEDALCLVLGVDDGDDRWLPVFEQQPGGRVGVRIELEPIGKDSDDAPR